MRGQSYGASIARACSCSCSNAPQFVSVHCSSGKPGQGSEGRVLEQRAGGLHAWPGPSLPRLTQASPRCKWCRSRNSPAGMRWRHKNWLCCKSAHPRQCTAGAGRAGGGGAGRLSMALSSAVLRPACTAAGFPTATHSSARAARKSVAGLAACNKQRRSGQVPSAGRCAPP